MFYLKNDDMEELFRSAAENYEVDTGKASDWEAVCNAVHNSPPEDNGAVNQKKKRRFIFWWFLLFPAGWMAHNTWIDIGTDAFKSNVPVIAGKMSREHDMNNAVSNGNRQTDTLRGQITVNSKMEDKVGNHSAEQKYQQHAGHNVRPENENVYSTISVELQKTELHGLNHPLPMIALQIPQAKETTVFGNEQVAPQAVKKDEVKKNIHYFYLEGMAGPDLSTVKFQRISGTGSSFGLLAGYRMNKRLHIEAGAFLEKKIYYTDGEYFDQSKLPPYYQNVKMLYVEGNCKMVTVPLNIRYNVIAGVRSNWFIAGGMSSYFMNHEYYDYTYQHDNDPPKTRGYSYKVSEQDWMTVANFNVGYERTLWKRYNFRVEPYFRLPVSGVGTGNLSLSSGGIYLGIGRRF